MTHIEDYTIEPLDAVSKDKILLIEDNPGDARLVEILLEESDLVQCDVINKTSLADGMELLAQGETFGAILLDLYLPDSQGFETLEQLLDRFPNNNVIVLTGLADKSIGLNAVKAGAQDFLVKGAFDTELLAKSLRFSIERNKVIKRLELTQRIAHIGHWECSESAKTFSASEEVYRIFGLSTTTNFKYLDIQDRANPFYFLNGLHQETLKRGEVRRDITIKIPEMGDRHIFVLCTKKESGQKGQEIQGIVQDITERKRAEDGLIKSKERYQEIFTQSKDAIYIATFEGKFIDSNQATGELFGYSEAGLYGLSDLHQSYYPPEKKNEFLLKLKVKKSIKDFPIQVANKRGDLRNCLLTANLLVDEDFVGYNCIVRDITERIQAEKMRKARDLSAQSAKMKEQFIASISHEMRTPMNAILGLSNILIDMGLKGEELNLVSSIKQSSEILLGIVNDILEISAMQNQKIVFDNSNFDLHELLDNLVNVMQYKAQEKDLYFEVIYGTDVPQFLVGDKLRLNQVLYNLVGNAIKFTDNGFVKIYVKKLYDIADGAQIQFLVEDSGIGIAKDKIEAVFESFTRIRSKDRIFEGTGLGLSICKNIVQQQGGKIGATSEFGVGSKFFFDLIFEIGQSESDNDDNKEDEEIVIDENASFRLLLVEDHKMNQLVAKKTLTRKWKNIQLQIAGNGKIAIEKLEKDIFDIILLDIQMPVMDGYETAKYIREEMPDHIANLPILAMTAHAHLARDNKFAEFGMDDCVLKPFVPEDLFKKITMYLNR
ncbi:MAG: response regulator [Bacteroidota bacterium]